MNASRTRYLSTSLSLLATLLFVAACAGGLPPKASEKQLEQGWKVTGSVRGGGGIQSGAGSFKTKLNVYLFKTMDEFFCQQKTADNKQSIGDKSYLKDGKRDIGWHTVPLRVKIIEKTSNNRTIFWSYYCRGKIAQTP